MNLADWGCKNRHGETPTNNCCHMTAFSQPFYFLPFKLDNKSWDEKHTD
jgi:hypothetical protein